MAEGISEGIRREVFEGALRALLTETFDKVEGIYLDRGTSLFETLADISAEEASKPMREGGPTVAGHVEHMRFYLATARDYMQGIWYEKLDWKESWKVTSVTPAQWRDLQVRLREVYEEVLRVMAGFSDWNDERKVGGAIGLIAHTAYHLGAIRGRRG